MERSLDIETLFDAPSHSTREGLPEEEHQVWVVVSESEQAAEGSWIDQEACEFDAPLRICRRILSGGAVLIGPADPEQESRMARLLRSDSGGSA